VRATRRWAARKAFAAMVRLGLTPADVGMTLPSITYRLSSPRKRQSRSTADVRASRPMRRVPTACERVPMR
jgi:hypothetical protein